jgi:hypothetical protein
MTLKNPGHALSKDFLETLMLIHVNVFRNKQLPLPLNQYVLLMFINTEGAITNSSASEMLKISKQQDSKTVSVVITRDAWDVKKNALGQPICRVAYGYRILQTSQGKKAVSCSWAQDYQGGGKYGSLRHYGVGTESFYVK